MALKAPLTSFDKIYTLPMLTIKEDKGIYLEPLDIHTVINRVLD